MRLVGNALNGYYFDNLAALADKDELEHVVLAVAFVRDLGPIVDVARKRTVPVTMYALADGEGGFPSLDVLRLFVTGSPPSWQLYLTRRFYHPKIAWFRGVGCYIGSANLTDNGRMSNLECGVWLDEEELRRENWDQELASMLAVVRARSAQATREDIDRFDRLNRARATLLGAKRDFALQADKELRHIPGADSPFLVGKDRNGGAARAKFIEEWANCLTLLRKLGAMTATLARPTWVAADVSPAVAFDQATEYYYTRYVRRSGRRRDEVVDELHRQNRSDPEAAVRQVFAEWARFDGVEGTWEWSAWCNENPRRLRELLAPASLAALTVESLGEITWLTHSAREHARQVDNKSLGLPPGTQMEVRERCAEYARYLLKHRTDAGRAVGDVLEYVIWGDRKRANAAERVWDATRNAEWQLPHLGPSILGEMIGYARPDEFPPRNQRVVRTLVALGYEGLTVE